MLRTITFSFLMLVSTGVFANTSLPNIVFLQDGQASPKADLNAVSWLAGHWRGEALGGIVEEVWAPPLSGSMMGLFKLATAKEIKVYEIETISEEGGTLIFRLKHFDSLLKGWEEKDQSVEFRLVKVETDKVYFDGLTLERRSDNEIIIYVALREGEGEGANISEEIFAYKRVM